MKEVGAWGPHACGSHTVSVYRRRTGRRVWLAHTRAAGSVRRQTRVQGRKGMGKQNSQLSSREREVQTFPLHPAPSVTTEGPGHRSPHPTLALVREHAHGLHTRPAQPSSCSEMAVHQASLPSGLHWTRSCLSTGGLGTQELGFEMDAEQPSSRWSPGGCHC